METSSNNKSLCQMNNSFFFKKATYLKGVDIQECFENYILEGLQQLKKYF